MNAEVDSYISGIIAALCAACVFFIRRTCWKNADKIGRAHV